MQDLNKLPQKSCNKWRLKSTMRGKSPDQNQGNMFRDLKEICNPNDRLVRLSEKIPWEDLEEEFGKYYSERGRPSKPVRLMTSLLILKWLYDLGDETVVSVWVNNPYWQYFSGEEYFQWRPPIDPSELVHFRKRIGEKGVEKLFEISVRLHGRYSKEKEVVIDTTVQEKNITFPTDVKLHKKIIEGCRKIAKEESIEQRQTYTRTLKKLMMLQRFRKHPKNRTKARKAERKIKTIAGRLVRELERKLSDEGKKKYSEQIEIYKRILKQKRNDKNKVYSIHEPEVVCIAKGKEHKPYEFGSKAAIAITKNRGIIVGAVNFTEAIYDGHTLDKTITQVERVTGRRPEVAIVDRGFRGKKRVGETEIIGPKAPGKKTKNYEKQKARARFRRRAAIEPVIGHLKKDYRMARNYLKGSLGDGMNVLLSAAAFNFKKFLNELEDIFLVLEYFGYKKILKNI
jgi:IS5 family transposase